MRNVLTVWVSASNWVQAPGVSNQCYMLQLEVGVHKELRHCSIHSKLSMGFDYLFDNYNHYQFNENENTDKEWWIDEG